MNTVLNILASVLMAGLRVAGVTDPAFQAMAHLYVGGLYVAWWDSRDPFYLGVALALTGLESVCFVTTNATGLVQLIFAVTGFAFWVGSAYQFAKVK